MLTFLNLVKPALPVVVQKPDADRRMSKGQEQAESKHSVRMLAASLDLAARQVFQHHFYVQCYCRA